ncbi:MAG: NAD-dependent epimerase/dehydratase family protein, partial [Chloroflexota bacterium]
ETVPIYGPHKTFDFTYIDDAIEGVYRGVDRLVNDRNRVAGHAINLGSGQGTTLLQAAELIAATIGAEPRFTVEPMRSGEISQYVADLTRARTLLGYETQYPIARGIPEFWRWWQSWYGAPERTPVAAGRA